MRSPQEFCRAHFGLPIVFDNGAIMHVTTSGIANLVQAAMTEGYSSGCAEVANRDARIAQLGAELQQKNQQVASLERDKNSLNAQVGSYGSQVSSLNSQLSTERSQHANAMTSLRSQHQEALANQQDTLAHKATELMSHLEIKLLESQNSLKARDEKIQALEARLAEKDASMHAHESEQVEQNATIQQLRQQLQMLETRLQNPPAIPREDNRHSATFFKAILQTPSQTEQFLSDQSRVNHTQTETVRHN